MRWLALALLVGCATTSAPQPRVFRAPSWPDFEVSKNILRCAVERVDGREFAEKLLDVPFVEVEPYHLEGCYDPGNDGADQCYGDRPPPAIYINAKFEDFWHSTSRYELLCRRMLHLKEGSARNCTWERMEKEIKPRYALAIHECRIGASGTRLAVSW